MQRAFMFPGQSSRDPEMVERAFAIDAAVAARVLEEASALVERDLGAHFRGPAAAMFATNQDVQLGVFLTTHIHLEALRARGIDAALSLGLSLGEYNHLVHIGALDFADAVRLVAERGRLYTEGPTGCMAAVYPIADDDLAPLLEEARAIGPVDVAVEASPTQTVIAGDHAAVQHVAERAADEHYAEHKLIEEHVPMHVPMFASVAEAFGEALARAPFKRARLPYLPNVEGRHVPTNGPASFAAPLYRHVVEAVRWRRSIDYLVAQGVTHFVEVGPRQALTNLLSPRWHRATRHSTDALDAPAQAFAQLAEELRA
ncbi:MAG: ACP S-malonyltransferase [Sandaracinaceae bacterium]|nr:ACP S-malonyltransferase [Sandaracinaceae bacterium]